MTPEERTMMEADRADWLERIARIIYEIDTMGEPGDRAFLAKLEATLKQGEQEWKIVVEEPYYQYWDDHIQPSQR